MTKDQKNDRLEREREREREEITRMKETRYS